MKSAIQELTQTTLFQKIGDICATVNTALGAQDLLEKSLHKIMDLYGATRGSVFIAEGGSGKLVLKASYGMKLKEEQSMVKQLGEGIVGRVAKLKQPLYVEDIASDERFQNFKLRGSYATPSFICAPLLVKDQLIGVINIADKETGSRFNETDMQLLDFLTTQVALNYRRIELHQKFKRIVREKENLKDRLGQTDQEKLNLKKQIVVHEKLATIGKLAGGIAHEFNNPLDGVMRYTNLCLDHIQDDEVVRGYLLEVKHGLNRMANIVRNLLACSRDEHPASQSVEIKQAFEHALSGKMNDIVRKNIIVERKIASNMPAIPDLGIERIFSNLITNAVDAIERDGRISMAADMYAQVLVISFADTGRGIEEENLEKIFEPFYTTKDIDKGCGLGLTIVGEIVKSYEGTINIESEFGKGTTFTIKIPVPEYDG
ncbi:MAG: GAF domain-containing protein [Candidatus Omnitrophica bacterium]|nr:GAF domain-containing protein [Candidatus Omnitrophota bacterium]MCB9721587.1 GAF domain-containing protein [Candidatus Omnitrophota bacterium]